MTSPVLVATSPPPPPPLPTTAHHHRLHHILTHSATIPIPHLKQIHAHILRTLPPPHHDPDTLFLFSRILHFSSLQDLSYTLHLFHHQFPDPKSTFIYNTLIRAFSHSKAHKNLAFPLFVQLMEDESGLVPDKHTFPFVIKGCAYLFALREGEQVHGQVLKRGFGSDVYVNNSLVHFFGSCGRLEELRKVFDEMPERSLVSWNAVIGGLVEMGRFKEGLGMFGEMSDWFEPDGFTMRSVVDACAGLGALSMGMWAHAYVLRKFGGEFDVLLGNSLVEMYCKCGALRMGSQVFEAMRKRDVNSWNAMILGFAMHGMAGRVFEHFDQMVNVEEVTPNSITFVGILSVCNHKGLVDEGLRYFNLMENECGIKPVLQHYGCLVDLLARNGRIHEALDIVSRMPMKPDDVIWRSLLDASCKNSEGLELSEEIAARIMEGEGSGSSGVYVLLSKVYASAELWNEVGLVRKLMTEKGVTKEPGCSLVEIHGIAHEFFAGDTTHPQTKEIYQLLDVIENRLKGEGYVPDCSQAPLVDEVDDDKGRTLRLHSERLAISFGLLNSKPGIPIRVLKNLRVCKDCHEFCKLVSKIFDVEIIMRDRLRFHHFTDGSCSCMDFW